MRQYHRVCNFGVLILMFSISSINSMTEESKKLLQNKGIRWYLLSRIQVNQRILPYTVIDRIAEYVKPEIPPDVIIHLGSEVIIWHNFDFDAGNEWFEDKIKKLTIEETIFLARHGMTDPHFLTEAQCKKLHAMHCQELLH